MQIPKELMELIGDLVLSYKLGTPYPFEMQFESGGLTVECPWRLHRAGETVLGYTDLRNSVKLEEVACVLDSLLYKKIIDIKFYSDVNVLCIIFEEGYQVDLFHDSLQYEGWEVYTNSGFTFIS
ncbi:hypothetical protein SM124_15010 [Bacillus sp. 31A1R]|uniref:Uncharacterized protein n=1 Tax=Robertmurraya mangrovi TaxID=3098077 RepID=A0ABU5J0Y4_9BACI|nr:hypothetical protein [Bacillus sp. 31A1R]MDZ5473026.1 hypothetical protein [Bacillus sp. 31A1R]